MAIELTDIEIIRKIFVTFCLGNNYFYFMFYFNGNSPVFLYGYATDER